jgi:hypothetical protein
LWVLFTDILGTPIISNNILGPNLPERRQTALPPRW